MQRLVVSGAVGPIYGSLGVKRLSWLIAKIILRCTVSKTSKFYVLFCTRGKLGIFFYCVKEK